MSKKIISKGNDEFKYTVDNGEVTITKYKGSKIEVTIPAEIDGKPVTSIGDCAFSGCSSLTSIVVELGNPVYDSRDNCNAIIRKKDNTLIAGCGTTIIPNSVTSIGDCAFEDCRSLTKIEIPNSVTSIELSAFWGCSSLERIEIPNSVTSIGPWAFYGCSSLERIEIPNSVTRIGLSAFWECSSLERIEIPNSVTRIGNFAFYNSGIKTIYGEKGSYAEAYANKIGITFEEI